MKSPDNQNSDGGPETIGESEAARQRGRYLTLVAKYRALIVALVAVATLVAGYGAVRLEFDAGTRIYFSADSPERQALDAVEERHGSYATAVLLAVPASGNVYESETLEVLRDLTAAVKSVTGVAQVASLTAFRPLRLAGGRAPDAPLLSFGEVPDDAAVERIRASVQQDRDRTRALVSDAGDVTSVIVLIDDTVRPLYDTLDDLDQLLAVLRSAHPDIPLHMSGDAAMYRTFTEAILRDLTVLAPVQALLLVVFLVICLQSLRAVAALLVVLLASTAVTMGLAGWLGVELNGVTSTTPMILLGLAVATGIHVVMTWQQALRGTAGDEDSGPIDSETALETSLRINFVPVALATLTTAVSFLCLNFSDSPPFRTLGNLVAFGLILTFLLTFTFLPALMTWLPPQLALRRKAFERAMAHLGGFVVKRHKLILCAGLAIAVTCAWGTRQLTFDDRFSQYFSERFAFRQATDILEQRLTGLTALEFSLPAGLEGGAANPAFLADADQFAAWMRQQPETAALSSPTDIVRRLAAFDPGAATTDDGLPATLEAGHRVLSILRAGEDILPGRPLSEDGKFALVTVVLRGVSSDDVRGFAERAEDWLQLNTPSIATQATGLPLLAAHMSQRNTKSMLTGTLVALVAVSLILVAAFKSFRFGAVSLVPNLLPLLIAYGLWGAVLGEVTFSATVVLAVAFGIVVDDTVHFLAKYRLARNAPLRLAPPEAVVHALRTVGVALVATTISIVSGFITLAFSGFLVNHHLGLLTTFTLLAALGTAILLLPAFLVLVDRRR